MINYRYRNDIIDGIYSLDRGKNYYCIICRRPFSTEKINIPLDVFVLYNFASTLRTAVLL